MAQRIVAKAQRGRPKLADGAAAMTLRISETLKAQLSDAASENGRSLADEIRTRLEASIDGGALGKERAEKEFGGPATYWLMRVFALVIGQVQSFTGNAWNDDQSTLKQARDAITAILECMEAPEARPAAAASLFAATQQRLGQPVAATMAESLGRIVGLGAIDQVVSAAPSGAPLPDNQRTSDLMRTAQSAHPFVAHLFPAWRK